MSGKKTAYSGFVRTEEAPLLPPPPSQVGITGWLWNNIFASMANFSSPMAAIQSLLMFLLTVGVLWFGYTQFYALLDFALFSAVFSDPETTKRLSCATVKQGGELDAEWYGACWPFIIAKTKFLIYGKYPMEALWRVDLVFASGAIGLGWVLWEGAAYRKYVGAFMLTIWPVIAFILLTGGGIEVSAGFWLTGITIILVFFGLGWLGSRGIGGEPLAAVSGMITLVGMIYSGFLAAVFFSSLDYGMEKVDTSDWGGLLVTLVVAVTGIVASLPLGIILALGRRSQMPVARMISTVFIEFWRGVPLITVLFMASVMLPLFLPEGVDFDKLLRALIGVALFSAAYMAEVVRGGLQAMPRGQYEGAEALGLPYWKTMRLIILPQALTHVIPGIVNTFIGLFKDTTLVLIIGIYDFLGAIQASLSDANWSTPVQGQSGYLAAAIIYWIFCFSMSRYSVFMERKLRRGHER